MTKTKARTTRTRLRVATLRGVHSDDGKLPAAMLRALMLPRYGLTLEMPPPP